MLLGVRLQQAWHHARAHRFFAAARWSADQLGLVLLDLIVELLVPDAAPVRLVCDDTLHRRSGRKVFGAGWHHDPLAPGRHRVAWANNWVVVGVLVDLPFIPHRPVCLPILARLWQPRHTPGRRTWPSRWLGWPVSISATAASTWSWTAPTPARRSATCPGRPPLLAGCTPTPPWMRCPGHPGRPGRPRSKGDRLPDLTTLAGLVATPTQLVERYAARWQVEVCFREARQDAGVGQARNRTRLAVQRTVPFGLVCYSLAVVWYTQHGHPAHDLAARRALAPWYQTKQAPSLADMLTTLRRVLLAAQYRHGQAPAPTMPEILQVQAAWAAAAA